MHVWDETPFAVEKLRRAGFSRSAIRHLLRLRRRYIKYDYDLDQAPPDLTRLTFVRYLVRLGKLTDEIL